MTAVTFTVPMQAVPWQRSRHNGKQHFMARRSRDARTTVQTFARSAMRGKEEFTGPVELEALFVMKRAGLCDVDNLLKSLNDSLNGIVWTDDRIVHRIVAEKRPCGDKDPFIEVTVRSIADER